MRRFKLLKCCAMIFILFLLVQVVIAQDGYKGIIPMKSTCHDVKNSLGSGKCGIAEETFKFPEERVVINYSTKKCDEFYGKKWDVPVGTVIGITRFFRKSFTLKQLGMQPSELEYNKCYTDVLNQVAYERKNGGLSFVVSNDLVNYISYTPTSENNSEICNCN